MPGKELKAWSKKLLVKFDKNYLKLYKIKVLEKMVLKTTASKYLMLFKWYFDVIKFYKFTY